MREEIKELHKKLLEECQKDELSIFSVIGSVNDGDVDTAFVLSGSPQLVIMEAMRENENVTEILSSSSAAIMFTCISAFEIAALEELKELDEN